MAYVSAYVSGGAAGGWLLFVWRGLEAFQILLKEAVYESVGLLASGHMSFEVCE